MRVNSKGEEEAALALTLNSSLAIVVQNAPGASRSSACRPFRPGPWVCPSACLSTAAAIVGKYILRMTMLLILFTIVTDKYAKSSPSALYPRRLFPLHLCRIGSALSHPFSSPTSSSYALPLSHGPALAPCKSRSSLHAHRVTLPQKSCAWISVANSDLPGSCTSPGSVLAAAVPASAARLAGAWPNAKSDSSHGRRVEMSGREKAAGARSPEWSES